MYSTGYILYMEHYTRILVELKFLGCLSKGATFKQLQDCFNMYNFICV